MRLLVSARSLSAVTDERKAARELLLFLLRPAAYSLREEGHKRAVPGRDMAGAECFEAQSKQCDAREETRLGSPLNCDW